MKITVKSNNHQTYSIDEIPAGSIFQLSESDDKDIYFKLKVSSRNFSKWRAVSLTTGDLVYSSDCSYAKNVRFVI